MTRINTNVGSLVAQQNLARSNEQLQTSLTRLSTGLRINTGKDDPAGLIASENLRRDITSANTAITNSQQADQLISTADSALGQISNLLNDVRGLVVQSANTGVLSSDQIAANQLQVDSSLEAIDRIAKVTTFQGRKLLDGTLDFTKAYTAGASSVSDLKVNQANLGNTGNLAVNVNITSAATQGQINDTAFGQTVPAQASGLLTLANGTLTVNAKAGGAADGYVGDTTVVKLQASAGIVQATGTSTLANGSIAVAAKSTGAFAGVAGSAVSVAYQAAGNIVQGTGTVALTNTNETFDIAAVAGKAADGAKANSTTVVLQDATGANPTAAVYDANTNTLTVSVKSGDKVGDITNAIDTEGTFATSNVSNAATAYVNTDNGNTSYTSNADGNNGTTTAAIVSGAITVSVGVGATVADVATQIAGLNGGADFTATPTNGTGLITTADLAVTSNLANGNDGTTNATYDTATNTLTINAGVGAKIDDIRGAINATSDFTAIDTSGTGLIASADKTTYPAGSLTGGIGTGLAADLVVRIAGAKGSEVFNFKQGATVGQFVNAVNLVSDATGVQAVNNAGALQLQSTTYGSAGNVDVEVLSEGAGGAFGTGLSNTHAAGTDIVGTINGTTASGKGNTLSVNTSSLDLSLTVSNGSTTAVSFDLTGGGAVFQLGPDVVTNQQARIGISSVNTATLGGTDGRLYELRSGNDKDLSTNPTGAASVVDEAINKVTSLRGRLGAFQATTLSTNIASLTDTVTNLTAAQSSIRDADFATETANLTRAQVLVQSGTQVLSIANQGPQAVLALLRNA